MVFIRLSFHHHVWKIWQGTELIPFFSSSTLNTSFCILLVSIISNEKLAVTIVLLYVMCHFPLATFKTFALLKFKFSLDRAQEWFSICHPWFLEFPQSVNLCLSKFSELLSLCLHIFFVRPILFPTWNAKGL